MDHLLTSWILQAQSFTKCLDYFFLHVLNSVSEFNVNVNDAKEECNIVKIIILRQSAPAMETLCLDHFKKLELSSHILKT